MQPNTMEAMLSLTFISSEFGILTSEAGSPKTLPQAPLSPTRCLTVLAASTTGSSRRSKEPKASDVGPETPLSWMPSTLLCGSEVQIC